jgi:putative ABC transport system permease protein
MIFVRLLTQTVFLALGQIWANKVRAILTTLGIVIGVGAVISVVAATDGLQRFVLKEFASIGASKVWVFPRMPREARDRYSWRQIRMTTREVDGMLDKCPSLARLTPVMEMSMSVQFEDVMKQSASVQAIRPAWGEIEQRAILKGRPFSTIDEEERLPVCLVNDKAIDELGLNRDPTGESGDAPQRVLLSGRAFTIIGVVETKAVSPMFGGDETRSEIFIPFRTGEMLRSEPRMYVIAQTKSPEQYEDAKAEIEYYMRRMRSLRPEEPNTFGVEALEQIVSQFKTMALYIKVFMACIVAISLLVGGIGIMNIMLSSVSERTREIGLRKAVGAQPAVILMQFLVEAVTLCLVGGAIGMAIGQGLILALKFGVPKLFGESVVPLWAVALSVLFSAATGVVFGMLPAIKAARLNPIDALRHE